MAVFIDYQHDFLPTIPNKCFRTILLKTQSDRIAFGLLISGTLRCTKNSRIPLICYLLMISKYMFLLIVILLMFINILKICICIVHTQTPTTIYLSLHKTTDVFKMCIMS